MNIINYKTKGEDNMSGMSIEQFMAKPTRKERLEKLRKKEEKLDSFMIEFVKLMGEFLIIWFGIMMLWSLAPHFIEAFIHAIKQVMELYSMPLGGFPR
jgi:hypothetical protein